MGNTLVATGTGTTPTQTTATTYTCKTGTFTNSDFLAVNNPVNDPESVTWTESACEYGCKQELVYAYLPNDSQTHQIIGYTRGCSSIGEAVSASCTTTTVIDDLIVGENLFQTGSVGTVEDQLRSKTKVHKCTQVCQSDNCNINWPARPTCFTCANAGTDRTDETTCFRTFTESESRQCNYYEDYCEIHHTAGDLFLGKFEQIIGNEVAYNQGVGNGNFTITRGCASSDIQPYTLDCEGHFCQDVDLDVDGSSRKVEECRFRCTENYCNFGPGLKTRGAVCPSSATQLLTSILALIIYFLK